MAMFTLSLCMVAIISCVTGQRPFFAGSKPIGFPELYDRPTTEGLGNRFGESNGTTPRLPLEAQGDRELVDRLSKLPIDQQPFWLINWQALEANRQKPQTYPQKPNTFVDNISTNPGGNQNTGNLGVNNQNSLPNANNFNTPNRNNFAAQNNNNDNRFNTPSGINNNNLNKPLIRNPNPNQFNTPNQNTQSNNFNNPSKVPNSSTLPTKTANNANSNNQNGPYIVTTGSVGSKSSVTQVTKPSNAAVTSKTTPKAVQKDNAKPSDYSDEYGSVEDFNSGEVETPEKAKLDKFVALI